MKILKKLLFLLITTLASTQMHAAQWAVSADAKFGAAASAVAAAATHVLPATGQEEGKKMAQAADKAKCKTARNNELLATRPAQVIGQALRAANTPLLPDLVNMVALYGISPWFTQKIKPVRTLHGSGVACSNKKILATNCTSEIQFYGPDRTRTHTSAGLGDLPSHMAYLPTGILAVQVGDNTLVFLNPDGTEHSRWTNHDRGSQILSIRCLSDGTLAVALNNRIVFFWPDGTERTSLAITGIRQIDRFSNGILAASSGFSIEFLNSNGTQFKAPVNLGRMINSIACSSTDTLAVCLHLNTIVFFNQEGTELARRDIETEGTIKYLAWSPDGQILALGSYHNLLILNYNDRTCIMYPYEQTITNLVWLPDGTLAVASGTRYIDILEPSDESLDNLPSTTTTSSTATAGAAAAAAATNNSSTAPRAATAATAGR